MRILVLTLIAAFLLPVAPAYAYSPAPDSGKFFALGGDPLRPSQWALPAHQFNSYPTDGQNVVVAVIDSGVDVSHPDLAGKVLPGRDLVDGTYQGVDPNGHGTHVAGVIAALTDNDAGIAGAAPAVQILPVRVLDATGEGWEADVAEGITWAVDNGADILNLSLGGNPDSAVEAAVQYAADSGVLVVAAAGNSGQLGNAPSYPAAYATALAVGAASSLTQVAAFSNTGPYLDITAAGVSIASTYLNGSYVSMSGTSMAAPYVAAAAAVLLSTDSSLSPIAAAQRLTSNATDMYEPGPDDRSGAGLLNVAAAICQCSAPPTGVTPPDSNPSLPPLPQLPDLPVLTPPALPGFDQEPLPVGTIPSPGIARPSLPMLPPLPNFSRPSSDVVVNLKAKSRVKQGARNTLLVNVTVGSRPAPGAQVKVTGAITRSAKTSSSGRAKISLPSQANSRYIISVTTTQGATKNVSHTVWVEPKFKARSTKKYIKWTLATPSSQFVTLYKYKKGKFVPIRSTRTPPDKNSVSGRFKIKKKGQYRVAVSPALGLVSVQSKVFNYGK